MVYRLIMTIFICVVLSSCSVFEYYPDKASSYYIPYRNGNMQHAVEEVNDSAEGNADSRSRLLYRLEQGTILLAAGKFKESIKAFEAAEEAIRFYEDKSKLKGAHSQVGAVLVNDKILPYTGCYYEKIMLNTYKALAYTRMGNFEGAKVELRRAYRRQEEAKDHWDKEIARIQQEADNGKVPYKQLDDNKELDNHLKPVYARLAKYQSQTLFVNPFTTFLDGLVFLSHNPNGTDMERARKSFEKLLGMIPDSAKPMIETELKDIEKRFSGEAVDPIVYVIHENGLSPIFREIRFDIPIFHHDLSYVGIAFPVPEIQPIPHDYLAIKVGSETVAQTRIIANMNAIVAREYEHKMKTILLRSFTSAFLKAVMQVKGSRANDKHAAAFHVMAVIYSFLTTRADLRTWMTLPGEFQMARLKLPKSRKIFIESNDKTLKRTIELPDGKLILVYIKSPSRAAASVQVIKLR